MGILDAPALPVKEHLRIQQLGAFGRTDIARSQQLTAKTFTDRTQFIEQWANLTSWNGAAPGMQVSGGKAYGNGGSGGTGGMNHALGLTATDTARIVTSVNLTGAFGGQVGVGISTAAAGVIPGAAGSGCYGLFFSTGTGVGTMVNGTVTYAAGSVIGGLWTVTIDIGLTLISVTAVSPDGTVEVRWQGARATYAPNNLWVFNSNAGALSGSSVGPIGVSSPRSTTTPRAGIEGLGRTICAETLGTTQLKLELPPTYDPRVPCPLIIMLHGNGSDEHVFADNNNQKATLPALIAAGFMVLSVSVTSNLGTWGAQLSLDAYTTAYRWVRDRFNIGPVGLFANSMGGIESELLLAEGRIPNIVAWAGHSPTANLATNYANATFTAIIKTAYGVASDGSDYATKTAGHDPLLMPGYAFRGLPMLFLAATDDTTVPKAQNTDLLAALVAPYSPEVVVQGGITGGHSFSTAPYVTQIVGFFQKYFGLAA